MPAELASVVDRSTLLRMHYAFQEGGFLSQVEPMREGLLAFSESTPGPMWNHSAWIEGSAAEFEAFVEAARAWHLSRARRPVVYLGADFSSHFEFLLRNGYSKFDEEAWLCQVNPAGQKSSSAREVLDVGSRQQLAEIFSTAFALKSRDQANGLLRDPAPGTHHFILSAGGQPVSSGTVIARGEFGGIYNIGTVPSARGRGFGREMVQHLIAVAAELGCRTLFLQVENGSPAQRLYGKLGFKTEFIRYGFRLGERADRENEATLLSQLLGGRAERPIEQQTVGRETHALPAGLIDGLRSTFGANELQSVFSAGWAYLLHRYTGQEVVAFARGEETAAGWRNCEIALRREALLKQWIREIGKERKGAYGGATLETLLSLTPEKFRSRRDPLAFPLEIKVDPENPVTLQIAFRSGEFRKDSVRRMAAHFVTILESMVALPEGLVKDLEILPDTEKQQLLVAWNESRFTPVETTIVKLFEEQVERSPDAGAAVLTKTGSSTPVEQLTYRQLNRRANRLAHRLQEMGVGPETSTAVLLDRSLEFVVALLAIFKAGGVCVPIDPSFPPDRIAFILQDAEARVVVSRRSLAAAVPVPRQIDMLFLGEGAEALSAKDKNPIGGASGQQGAYIIYTSGSTGMPKGVVVTHHGLANHCLDCRKEYGLSPHDKVLQFSAFNFDAALEQILPALISGSVLVVRDNEVWSVREFGEKLRQFQLTVADIPTPYWHELAEFWTANPAQIPRNSLRLMIVGGEALSPKRLAQWQSTALGQLRLINAYGPTEAIVTATSYEVPPDRLVADYSVNVPIGRPRADRKVYVLDPYGDPVPVGVPGELYLGGTLLARGYFKQATLSASRFIPNPFSDAPDARLYKTGDLVRYLSEGDLEFLGRADDQVKIRGYRIELGEIEAALRKHPAVREAIVMARAHASGEKRLAGYVTSQNSHLGPDELRKHLQKFLPSYMVPSHFSVLASWPLLPNGKVDRRALPEPNAGDRESENVSGPRDPLELQIQLLFERVLRRAPVGIDQSFFELGGDSLQALELLVQIEKEAGRQLPLGTLYQASTVEALARELRGRVAPEQWSSLVPLQSGESRPPFFLLHTTPGDILGYGNLVYRLGPDQPCFGFQSLGLKDAHLSHTSIEEMARYYVDLLRRFQPRGPYFLGGWCYGGILAVEMARVLRAQGEEIGLLALLETVAMPAELSNWQYYLHRARCFLRMSPTGWVRYAREKLKYRRNSRLANRMRFRQVEESKVQAGRRDPRLEQLEHVYNTNLVALSRYRSKYYDGTVSLFNAAEKDGALIPDRHYGWIGLAAEIEINEVPGNHDSMLAEPNVAILARLLDERLRLAQSRKTSP